jgi:1,4-alpha-glucan branching enzyme
MSHKFFCLVLHSHIPYVVGHGTWPHGTDWLYEAAAESYLPLLRVLDRLHHEGYSPDINISFTPVLMEQLKSQSFLRGFRKYLKLKKDVAEKDRLYFEKSGQKELSRLADFWRTWYEGIEADFTHRWQEDILSGFRRLQDEGLIEILTSAATHAYLPLLSHDESLRLQLRQGKFIYEQNFGRSPAGFWLPECAYRPAYFWKRPVGKASPVLRPAIDELLREMGLLYFLVDFPLLRGSEVRGVYFERFPALKRLWEKSIKGINLEERRELSPYWPYLSEPSGLAFLVRDERTGQQVWSSSSGYPGDGWYLEFHKKHFPGGLRYWRVTASHLDLGEKLIYQPEKVEERLESHAHHFVSLLHEILKEVEEGVVASFYDTELFGHWWFEGPEWLYRVLKKLHHSPVKPVKASCCLEKLKPQLAVKLPEGSWGSGGFHWIWLNEDTAWIWEKIYWLEDEMARLPKKLLEKKRRLWRQLLREKFLLESSDWPFLISTWTARDYAEHRASEHYQRARTLISWINQDRRLSPEEEKLLAEWEKEDGLFREIAVGEKEII